MATATPAPVRARPTPPADSPGGVLKLAVSQAAPHFDIQREVSPALSTWGVGLIYSRLFRYAAEPDSLIECELCESWELAGPRMLRARLRPDVLWQDRAPLNGRRLAAGDLVFSYERQREAGAANSDLLRGIGAIEAPDARTIEFEIAQPNADLLFNLADGRSRIVAPEAVAENGDLRAGPNVGTGPWELLEATDFFSIYERNESYFEPGLPYLDGLEVTSIPDARTRVIAFRVGMLDIVDATGAEAARALQDFPEVRAVTVTNLGAGAEIAINTSVPPFVSPRARAAVFSALDPWRDALEVWGGDGIVTLGLPVPDPSWLLPEDAMRTAFADAERARGLLSLSDVTPGEPVEITVGQFGDQYLEQARRLAETLGGLGFDTVIREVSTRVFADEVWIGGDYQVFVGAQAPVDGLSDDLFSVYHSRGAWNTTGYHSQELDELIEQQAAEMDPAVRKRLVQSAQVKILAGAHRFTVAARVTHWLQWPYVHGFSPSPARGENHFLSLVSVGEKPDLF